MGRRRGTALWSALLCTVICFGVPGSVRADDSRPKIGLVLSGGGARGAAHIGVLRVLEAEHIPIDYIAGTSMGAIVGGLYASGYTVDQIDAVTRGLDWDAAFEDDVEREKRSFRRKQDDSEFASGVQIGLGREGIKLPAGVVTGQSIELILSRLFAPVSDVNDFDQLPTPFRAVAADIVTSEAVVMDHGSLATAVRASMSIPGIITPIERDGHLLVDGGVANNLPVSVVREMGADIVIAVDISTPFRQRDEIKSVLDVADQLTNFLTRKNTREQIELLSDRDVLITPILGNITASDFDRAGEAIALGEKAAAAEPGLAALGQTGPRPESPTLRQVEGQRIDFIRLVNDSSIPDTVLFNRIDVHVGDALDFDAIERDIDQLYGLGYFSTVGYRLLSEADGHGLEYTVTEKPWGPNYLQLGMRFSTSEDTDNRVNLYAGYLMTNLNELGAELRTSLALGTDPSLSVDYYQPLDYRFTPFVQPRFSIYSNQYNFFDGNQLLAEATVEAAELDLGFGVELENWGVFRFGTRIVDGRVSQRVGIPLVEDSDFTDVLLYAGIGIDTLDSLYFPQSGYRANLTWQQAEPDLGADSSYEQWLADATFAQSWSGHSLTTQLKYYRSWSESIPLNSAFRAGGFLDLSGYQFNQLTGRNYGLASLVYMYRWPVVRYFPVYLGASVERGNVWNEDREVRWGDLVNAYSVFVGVDTVLGPFFVAGGYNDENSGALYLRLDRAF